MAYISVTFITRQKSEFCRRPQDITGLFNGSMGRTQVTCGFVSWTVHTIFGLKSYYVTNHVTFKFHNVFVRLYIFHTSHNSLHNRDNEKCYRSAELNVVHTRLYNESQDCQLLDRAPARNFGSILSQPEKRAFSVQRGVAPRERQGAKTFCWEDFPHPPIGEIVKFCR